MTEKQQERIRTKIKNIKLALADDKKRWGGEYDDSRGLRYAPPQLYIQLADFSGGVRYMNWFTKNFPDDNCYPDFLFEWTIILFKTGKLKEAEKIAFKTFCRNTHLLDNFSSNQTLKIDKNESSNLEIDKFVNSSFKHIHSQNNLTDVVEWFNNFIKSEKFILNSNKIIEINRRLKNENDIETRGYLVRQMQKLEKDY